MEVRKASCKGVTVTCHKQFLCRELNKGFRNCTFCNKPSKERKKGKDTHALQVDGCSKKVDKKEREGIVLGSQEDIELKYKSIICHTTESSPTVYPSSFIVVFEHHIDV